MTDQPTPTAAQIAKVRRSGATWNETREHFGLKWGSGKFTAIMNEAGFDAGGAKLDGSGPESGARYRRRDPHAEQAKRATAKHAKPTKRLTAKEAALQMLSFRPEADFEALKRSMAGKTPAERRKALDAARE